MPLYLHLRAVYYIENGYKRWKLNTNSMLILLYVITIQSVSIGEVLIRELEYVIVLFIIKVLHT